MATVGAPPALAVGPAGGVTQDDGRTALAAAVPLGVTAVQADLLAAIAVTRLQVTP
jgi:hypothetical protein